MKKVDLGEATSCLDYVYLGCTQRECNTKEDIVEHFRNLFESRISSGATEKVPSGKPHVETVTWSNEKEGTHRNAWKELANKTTKQLYKVSSPCLDDHSFKEEEMTSARELPKVCSS